MGRLEDDLESSQANSNNTSELGGSNGSLYHHMMNDVSENKQTSLGFERKGDSSVEKINSSAPIDNNSSVFETSMIEVAKSKKSASSKSQPCVVLGYGVSMPESNYFNSHIVGLVNLGGGTCFLNVILQFLCQVDKFRDYYINYKDTLPPKELLSNQYESYVKEINNYSTLYHGRQSRRFNRYPQKKTSISWEMAVILNYLCKTPKKYVKPDALYHACIRIIPHFDPREMQDCDEFLRHLLDILEAELISASTSIPVKQIINGNCIRVMDTHISLLFEGMEIDEIQCLKCHTKSRIIVPFKSLAIAMTPEAQRQAHYFSDIRAKPSTFVSELRKVDLEECLSLHFSTDTESLKKSTGEGYQCSRCNTTEDAVKQLKLVAGKLPYILCLSLKRFVRGRQTYKIWNPIFFSEVLDISPYVESNLDSFDGAKNNGGMTIEKKHQEAQISNKEILYTLIAVIQHDGPATDQGHYYCYVKHLLTNCWYRVDDKASVEISLSEVFAASPYMLIYKNISESWLYDDLPSYEDLLKHIDSNCQVPDVTPREKRRRIDDNNFIFSPEIEQNSAGLKSQLRYSDIVSHQQQGTSEIDKDMTFDSTSMNNNFSKNDSPSSNYPGINKISNSCIRGNCYEGYI